MNLVLLAPDGASDVPLDALGGRTPLAAARLPAMCALARRGFVGLARTIPEGCPPGSDIGYLSLLGYDPRTAHTGRAPLEAAGRGIALLPGAWAFRANLVSLGGSPGAETMADFAGGHIPTEEASPLVADLDRALSPIGVRLHAGISYRHLAVFGGSRSFRLETTPPHDIPGQPIVPHLPRGDGAERIRSIMERSREVIAGHPVRRRRLAAGATPPDMLWLWGEGRAPSFAPRVPAGDLRRGAAITAVDIVRGVARLAGLLPIEVPGATGYLDTDYGAKARAAVAALDEADLLLVHVEAPDEAAHQGNAAAKVRALEEVDAKVLAPLVAALEARAARGNPWRLLLSPDHATSCLTKTHIRDLVPFVIAGPGVPPRPADAFTEEAAARTGVLAPDGPTLFSWLRDGPPARP